MCVHVTHPFRRQAGQPDAGLVPAERAPYAAALMSTQRIFLLISLGMVLCEGAMSAAYDEARINADAPPDLPLETETLNDEVGAYASRTRSADGDWQLPTGDAVLIDEEWWTPLRPLSDVAVPRAEPDAATLARVRERIAPPPRGACRTGSPTPRSRTSPAMASPTLVLSFRRPFQRNFINVTRPRRAWVDRHGLSAHLGLYRPDDLSEIWVAGTLRRPVADGRRLRWRALP